MSKNTLEAGELSIQTHDSQPRILPPSPASFLLSECKHNGAGIGVFSTPCASLSCLPRLSFHNAMGDKRIFLLPTNNTPLLSPSPMVTEVKHE